MVKKNQVLVKLLDNEEQAIKKQIYAELEEANTNYERAVKLSSKGNISQSILDNRLMIKKKLLAKADEIEARIEDLKIRAPFEGVTSIRNFSEGAFLKPGDIITNIFDIKNLKVQAFVPDSYSELISSNSNFFFTLDLKTKIRVKGKVSVVNPLVNEETKTFQILGKIKNINNKIKPGMAVNLVFPLEKREAYLVKEGAIFNEDDISYLYVIKQKNIISKKKIKIGSRNSGMVEIIEGISNDEFVVHEGINKIKDGSKVEVK